MEGFVEKKKVKTNWPLACAAVLFCLFLVSTYFTAGIFARYTAVGEGGDAAHVAAFVFRKADKAGSKHFIDLNSIRNPGDSVTYAFSVSNYSGDPGDPDQVCEVNLTYEIDLQLVGTLPLECTLTKVGGSGITDQLTSGTMGLAAGDMFDAAVARVDHYELVITWPTTNNDPAYANGVGMAECELEISAWQMD